MSLSIMLLCVVLTGVGSFRIDSYLETRMAGDVAVGGTGYTAGTYGESLRVDQELVARLNQQPGIRSKSAMWVGTYDADFRMDAQAMEKYRGFYEQGVLRADTNGRGQLARTLETGELEVTRYAYDAALLKNLKVFSEELDIEKFQKGLCYVLISGAVSIVLGSALSYGILRALNQVILFFRYRYNAWAFFILLPLFALIAWAVPCAAYKRAKKESIVERLRETEG